MIRNRGWMIVVTGALFAMGLVMTGYLPLSAQETKTPAAVANPFQGKVLAIYYKSKPIEYAGTLEEVTLTELAGQPALSGKWITTNDPAIWTSGLKVTIPIDDVSSIIEFDSVADYLRRATQHRGGRDPDARE